MVGKLKGAAQRLGGRVPGGGDPGGGERGACVRTYAAARGGLGPESRPPLLLSQRLPQPIWHRCSRRLAPLHHGAYELYQVKSSPRPGVRAQGGRHGGEGRAAETLLGSCRLQFLRPSCSSTPGRNTLDRLQEAVASTWSGQTGDER